MLGFMWFCVGALAVGAVWGMVELAKRFQLNALAWAGGLGGVGTLLFAIAWTVGSVVEGEGQAAALGAMMFGAAGVAIVALTARMLIKPKASAAE